MIFVHAVISDSPVCSTCCSFVFCNQCDICLQGGGKLRQGTSSWESFVFQFGVKVFPTNFFCAVWGTCSLCLIGSCFFFCISDELVLFKIWACQSCTQLIVHKKPRVRDVEVSRVCWPCTKIGGVSNFFLAKFPPPKLSPDALCVLPFPLVPMKVPTRLGQAKQGRVPAKVRRRSSHGSGPECRESACDSIFRRQHSGNRVQTSKRHMELQPPRPKGIEGETKLRSRGLYGPFSTQTRLNGCILKFHPTSPPTFQRNLFARLYTQRKVTLPALPLSLSPN